MTFTVSLKWNSRTRLKDIVQALMDQGYNSDEFEYGEDEKSFWTRGYCRMSKEDINKIVEEIYLEQERKNANQNIQTII